MKIAGSLCVALAGVATVVDQVTAREAGFYPYLPPTTCPPFLEVRHEDIVPFSQLEAKTITETAAVKFKPFLTISGGCDPYPAVTAGGYVSGGLRPGGRRTGNCKGNKYRAQVYGRSEWYDGHWYIAYAYYFPKEQIYDDGREGHRHGWQVCIVWLDNPANKYPKIKGVTVSGLRGFVKHAPPLPYTVDDTHVKLRYIQRSDGVFRQFQLESTELRGGDQALIQWHQLSESARCALNNTDWENGVRMPINDANIHETLRAGNPF